MESLVALAIVALLVLVHMCTASLRFLGGVPRSRWLSFAGGLSVSYVFVHILPELAESQAAVEKLEQVPGSALEHHLYLVAMIGLGLFYGLERAVRGSRQKPVGARGAGSLTGAGVFWLHIASFALYNMLIGYLLLHREESSETSLILFGVAMAVHFIVNDYGLREHHRSEYDQFGRWILAVAVVVGWLTGILIEVGDWVVDVLFAFLAGAIVLNVLKEELPEDRQSRFGAFAVGLVFYTAILLIGG